MDVGATVGIVLAITADGNKHYARNALKVHDGFSWSPGETFGFSDVLIPNEAERVEIVLIDNDGRATNPFAFAIVEGWLSKRSRSCPTRLRLVSTRWERKRSSQRF